MHANEFLTATLSHETSPTFDDENIDYYNKTAERRRRELQGLSVLLLTGIN